MTVSGVDIHRAVSSIRQLHRQVALLLQSADQYLVDERGYAIMVNACRDYGSANVDSPDEWMPNLVFRFYKPKPADASVVAFVSVILCPRAPEAHAVPYTEPIVSAGWVRFAEPPNGFDAKRYFWASIITEARVPRDGTVHRARGEGTKACLEYGCFAVPLVSIGGTDDLVGRVLDRLCKEIGGS